MYGTSFEYYIAQSDVSVYTKDLCGLPAQATRTELTQSDV